MHVLARDVLIEADFEGVVCGVDDTTDRLSLNRYTAALTAWEWLQREEHLFGAFEIAHHRPKARPNSVCVVHPKTGEEAWWPLFDETGKELFPELMPELDAIKERTVSGLVFRRDHDHGRAEFPCPDNITWRTGLSAGYR